MGKHWTHRRFFMAGLALAGCLVLLTAGCQTTRQPGTDGPSDGPATSPPSTPPPTTPPSPPPSESPPPAETPTEAQMLEAEKIELQTRLQDIHFDFDRYDLREDARRTLAENAAVLKRNRRPRILIEGHCDERGTVEYNLALGEKRAQAAQTYLIRLGIDAARIRTVSYGKERPLDPGHNEVAWARNRRAHFAAR